MLQMAVISVTASDSKVAGDMLGLQIRQRMVNIPDVVILFAAPTYDHEVLVASLRMSCPSPFLIGCSSAGEFANNILREGSCCAVALRATEHEMCFSVAVGRDLKLRREEAAFSLSAALHMSAGAPYPHHVALLLADGMAGQLDAFLDDLSRIAPETYEFFGGGAGDNAQFVSTPVFYQDEVISDAVVMLIIDSQRPIGIGASHGWCPATDSLYATCSNGFSLREIDGDPAVTAFEQYAVVHGRAFDRNDPLPFFLHTLIGMAGAGYRLRVPLAVDADGAVLCAAEVPQNAKIALMKATVSSPIEAAVRAANIARDRLYGSAPSFCLFFDCVATRLSLGNDTFRQELRAVEEVIGNIPYGGCNTHGQILRTQSQFSGFHNCTAVVALFPEFP